MSETPNCDKCGDATIKVRHHKHCRACVVCESCGWSNTHNAQFNGVGNTTPYE